MSVQILIGDCRERMKELPDASVDSVVCDPPYHLTTSPAVQLAHFKRDGKGNAVKQTPKRIERGFMGQTWDGGDVAFDPATWAEVLRVLKPGGHMVAFSGTRTYHRMVCAIEDAGFEIRDQLAWVYATGFPKSLDVSKAIDKAAPRLGKFRLFAAHYAERRKAIGLTHNSICEAGKFYAEHNHGGASSNWENGANVPTLAQWTILQPLLGLSDEWTSLIEREEAEREKVGERNVARLAVAPGQDNDRSQTTLDITAPATESAKQWQGWGTALKPSWEPICLARKPLIGSVAANILAHGTGALNIDGCRIEGEKGWPDTKQYSSGIAWGDNKTEAFTQNNADNPSKGLGRWPANLCHDGSDEVLAGFPESEARDGTTKGTSMGYGGGTRELVQTIQRSDTGSAARFFYCAKATTEERGEGNLHPTVKPVALMRWLCRLVTPRGGTILDPFMGSGSTGLAADAEQFNFIGCELSAEYAEIARKRIADQAGMFADIEVVHSVDARAA